MVSDQIYRAFYPDEGRSGTRFFYSLIKGHVTQSMVALDLGAGPGPVDDVRKLRGLVGRLIAVDIDKDVLGNPDVDEAHVISASAALPFESSTVDVIVSDYVFEHVENPSYFLREAGRVLKPGGRLYFRTPNLLHYVAMFSYLTPQVVHELLANRMRGLPTGSHDPYPTFYRMNRPATLRSLGCEAGFGVCEISMIEAEPSYMRFNTVPFLMGVGYERLVNAHPMFGTFRANIIGFLGKD